MPRDVLILGFLAGIGFFQIVKGQNSTCAENEFTCQNGECILKRWRCDAEVDCKDSSDELNCESFHACSSNEFQCKKSKICISMEWQCDGDSDCSDMSDEFSCHHSSCTPDEHRCTNGLCIQKSYLCDGDDDCGDSSDEESCDIQRCKENEFRCDSQQCIYIHWRCDGDKDCDNGRDETNCSRITCPPRQWACQSSECVPETYRCDGEPDCDDNSDEMGCPTVSGTCKINGQFRCSAGQCIKSEWRCDGDKDCTDGTDEKDCGPHTCPRDHFPCTSGRCIGKEWLCDGETDCTDGIDERNCTSKINSSSTVCLQTQFHCMNGQCIDEKQVCNREKDCSDGSDESQCPSWVNQTSCGTNNGGCQQKCHNDRHSFRCSCENGYHIDFGDPKSCTDLDECEIAGFCSQKCVNTQGSYNCSCVEGYVLQPDGQKCKALGPAPSFIFCNQVDIRRLETQTSEEIYTYVVDGLTNAIAVDYFFEGELVFWTDTTLREIKRAFINGTEIQSVIKFGLDTPSGLSVDWLGKKLFWVDSGSDRIEVTNLDGSQRKAVFWEPLGTLRAIASHPSKGYLFWTEWDLGLNHTKSSISRANMDGTGVQRIVHLDVAWPNGLVIDYATDRIFWIDAKLDAIDSTNLDGNSRRMVLRNDLSHPFAITVFEDYVYWTERTGKAIFKANKFDGRDYDMVKSNLKSPTDIIAFHPQRQPVGDYNCRENNGGCSHLCLATSTGFNCACPTGYKLLNFTHCSDDIDEFVAYVGNFAIRQISLDTNDMLDVVLPLERVMDVFAFDWDPVEDQMYWADNDEDQITIRRGKIKPIHQEAVVYEFPGKLSGIGVDWLSRKLYWSDEERNHIRVSNLDGSSATVVLWRKVEKPRNLILDVRRRYMYWSSHGKVVSIKRAGMDGYSRTTLISSGLVNPTCLTLDKNSNILYWADGGSKLHYFSLSSRKQNIVKLSHHSKTLVPFSLAVRGNDFYWSDGNLKKVLHANRNAVDKIKIIGKYEANPVRIAAFQRLKKLGEHPCHVDNGGCSHLCLLSPTQKFRCACPAGRRLGNDRKTCQSEILRFVLVNSDQRLHQVPLGVPYKTDVLLESEENNHIFTFDVDVKQSNVYFIKKNDNSKDICYVSFSGGDHTCILKKILYAPGGIAFDPLGRHIYWTDLITKKIYLADAKGKFWTVIIWENLEVPTSITVAYEDGFVFWTDVGKRTSINRANMDGSSRKEIVTSAIKWPSSIAVDHGAKRVYWTDYRLQQIQLCNFDGSNRKVLIKGLGGPTSIALLGRFVYWSEWNSKVIKKVDKRLKTPAMTVISGMRRLIGIKAVTLQKYPGSKTSCEQDNGGCSHFCLNNPAGISCVCPVGLKLLRDRKNCEAGPQTSILFSTGDTINRISLDTNDFTGFPLPLKNVKAVALAYDITGGRIYWTDTHNKRINSAFTNGTDSQNIIKTNLSSPYGLAIDWIGGNMYWSDAGHRRIEVSKLNGSSRTVLISEGLEKPRSLAVHPMKGLLFWTDLGGNPRIERAHMDGQSRKILVDGTLRHPTGLVIDFNQNLLYWADSFYHAIERCDLAGERRVLVVKKSGHPFGLTLFDIHIYWTDHKKRVVKRANKKTGSEQVVLQSKLARPRDIITVSLKAPKGTNACSEKNGNCSDLCLATPFGRSCGCTCKGRLCLKEHCQSNGVKTKPTVVANTNRCSSGFGDKCPSGTSYVTTKDKTMTLAYIVGGIVLIAFVAAMSILIFLCQRYLRGTFKKTRKNKPIVLFKKNQRENMFNEREIIGTDPAVCILPSNFQNPDESPPLLCRSSCKRTLAVTYQTKAEPDLNDESQRLTISEV